MTPETVNRWEQWAGIVSAAALLAVCTTAVMWSVQVLSWMFGGAVPHPSLLGAIRSICHWFGIDNTWADRPRVGFTAYNVVKHIYFTTSCVLAALVLTIASIALIASADRRRAALDQSLALGAQDVGR